MTAVAHGRARVSGPTIEVLVQSKRWAAEPRAAAIVRKAIRGAAQATSTLRSDLAIVLTHDSAIRKLNRQWRGFDKPTNVLSFPSGAPRRPRAPVVGPIGDIVIAFETTAREAKAEHKPFRHHLMHLAVHGYLHLLGHDHEDDREADRMERLETRILAALKVPDPYVDRPAAD